MLHKLPVGGYQDLIILSNFAGSCLLSQNAVMINWSSVSLYKILKCPIAEILVSGYTVVLYDSGCDKITLIRAAVSLINFSA